MGSLEEGNIREPNLKYEFNPVGPLNTFSLKYTRGLVRRSTNICSSLTISRLPFIPEESRYTCENKKTKPGTYLIKKGSYEKSD